MKQVDIRSLNVSEEKGTVKTPVDSVVIDETGVKGDAHAGYWHRQVSLLGVESLKRLRNRTNANSILATLAKILPPKDLSCTKQIFSIGLSVEMWFYRSPKLEKNATPVARSCSR